MTSLSLQSPGRDLEMEDESIQMQTREQIDPMFPYMRPLFIAFETTLLCHRAPRHVLWRN